MMHKKLTLIAALLSLVFYSAHARDMIVEGRGAYLRSSDSTFRDIYHNGGGIYGAQAVVQLYKYLYGFASADFFNKKGSSIGLCTPTRVNIINAGLGLEWMVPCCDSIDFYAGLGILPTQLRTVDDSLYVICKQKKWGCGGVAKFGFYFQIPEQPFILDFFADYAFVKISFNGKTDPLEQGCTANLNSGRFGVGFGYKFN